MDLTELLAPLSTPLALGWPLVFLVCLGALTQAVASGRSAQAWPLAGSASGWFILHQAATIGRAPALWADLTGKALAGAVFVLWILVAGVVALGQARASAWCRRELGTTLEPASAWKTYRVARRLGAEQLEVLRTLVTDSSERDPAAMETLVLSAKAL